MTLKEQIQAAENALAAAMPEKNSAEIAGLYTVDARLMPHGVPTLSGRTAIQGFFDQAFSMGIVGGKFTTLEVEGSGDEAVEIGSYELFVQTSSGIRGTAEKGRYLVMWKRVDGKWLLFRDMFNSDEASN
jgi:ketosteroid isomerase-like protein